MPTTMIHEPPHQASDEANEQQLQLARRQGEVLQTAVQEMTKRVAHGAEQRAGDYLVDYAVEEAEGLYHLQDGRLRWKEPEEENAHIEIAVRDGIDRRFVPGLTVSVTVLDSQGKELGTHHHPFLWHPWIYHYGRNWKLPGPGNYTLRVRIEAPDFPRHDKVNGRRYAEPVEVEFAAVHVETGRK